MGGSPRGSSPSFTTRSTTITLSLFFSYISLFLHNYSHLAHSPCSFSRDLPVQVESWSVTRVDQYTDKGQHTELCRVSAHEHTPIYLPWEEKHAGVVQHTRREVKRERERGRRWRKNDRPQSEELLSLVGTERRACERWKARGSKGWQERNREGDETSARLRKTPCRNARPSAATARS